MHIGKNFVFFRIYTIFNPEKIIYKEARCKPQILFKTYSRKGRER